METDKVFVLVAHDPTENNIRVVGVYCDVEAPRDFLKSLDEARRIDVDGSELFGYSPFECPLEVWNRGGEEGTYYAIFDGPCIR